MHQLLVFQIRLSWIICFLIIFFFLCLLGWKVKPTSTLLNYSSSSILSTLQGAGTCSDPEALTVQPVCATAIAGRVDGTCVSIVTSSTIRSWNLSVLQMKCIKNPVRIVSFPENEFWCAETHPFAVGINVKRTC